MSQPVTRPPKLRTLHVVGALLIVYLVWGGTYLGIRVAVETLPPFFMAGSRFLTAGLLVAGFALARGAARPTRTQIRDAAIVGGLLLLGGNGIVSWAEQRVPSGIAALMIATSPLWMLLLGLLDRGTRKPNALAVLGLLVGFAGVLVLVAGGSGTGPTNPVGLAALLLASVFWAAGSVYSRRAQVPASPMLAVGLQMIAGGALLLLVSALGGEGARLDPARVSLRSLLGMAYLVLLGSIVAYSAYIWLLKHADPTWVSTYAFVNPIVALGLGWLFAHERLTPRALAAAVIIVASVVLLTVNKNLEAKAARQQLA